MTSETTASSQPPTGHRFSDQEPGARVPTPGVLQMEASECGAVSLAIVLGTYGRYVALEELRQACGVNRDGSRASTLIRAAQSYGLEAKGVRVEPEDLFRMPMPAIAHWNFNHFVVIEGVSHRGVYLNDPETGHRRASWEEVDSSLTGVVIALRPGQDFVQEGSPPSVRRELAERARGVRPAIALCILAGLGLVLPGLIVPGLLRVFTDRYLAATGSRGLVFALVGGLLAASLVSGALTWLQQMTLVRLSARLSLSMSTRFFEHALRLPLTFFQQRYSGLVLTRLNANDRIAELLSTQLANAMLNVLTAVFFGALLFAYSWLLALVTLSLAVIDVMVIRLASGDRRESMHRVALEQGKLLSITLGGMQGIETLKASGEEAGFFQRFAGQQAKVLNRQQGSARRNALLQSFPGLLSGLTTVTILGLGGLLVIRGEVSIGSLVAFEALAASFTMPLIRLTTIPRLVEEVGHELESVEDVMRHPLDPEAMRRGHYGDGTDDPPQPPGAPTSPGNDPSPGGDRARDPDRSPARPRRVRLSGAIEFDRVTFGYDALGPPLLEEVSLRIRPGRRVAVVGASGSGKSTVARLAAGLYQPWSGRILFDGVDRRLISRQKLAASVAFVDQDVVLFEASVHDNLTLWDPTLDRPVLASAARDACIHDDVTRRPGGYDRLVAEGGRDWSGGQRQRLDIARALAGNPSLVVLDEATSSLDPLVERQIDRHLRSRGCACLIVAHRLSTVRDADEIVVLDGGRVVERGTHDELIALHGHYYSLVGA